MPNTIDERVVKMSFDNAEFARNVAQTLADLDKLNQKLKLQGAAKGLTDLSGAAGKVDLGHIGSAVDSIKSKFSAMSIIGIAAMASLATRAVSAGLSVVKAFTLDPISEGFKGYETQIEATQTILANTGLEGKKGLDQATAALANLQHYANLTVYNFADMAHNIGTFTAAGVKLDVATESIKGIANLAAMSGSSADQASSAMYQLSQAIAAGRVKLQDWNSVVNAGIGGKAFQQALYNTGVAFHTIKNAKVGESFDQWTAAGNSFRNSMQNGWITSKVLTATLQNFTGEMTAGQLKAEGYTQAQIADIQKMGKTAFEAATQIKTFHQMTQALKEEAATAFSSIFKTLFGDINQAKGLFTPLHNALENLITGPIYAFNKVLEGWSALGGRAKAIDAFKTAFKDLGEVLKPIKEAFREIFPATTGQALYKITAAIDDLFHKFKMGAGTTEELKHTFAGIFALFDIGWQIIKQVAKFLGDLLGAAGKGSGGVLKFTGSLGDMLVALDNALKHGEGLRKFFVGLESFIKPVIEAISHLVGGLLGLGSSVGPALGGVGSKVGNIISEVASKIKDFLKNIFAGVTFDDALKVFDTGLLAGLFLLIKKFVDKLKGGLNPFKGLVETIKAPFEGLHETLESMQKTLRATTIMEIAIAVGVLTVSVVELSKIDSAKLTKALTAITVMFGQLFGALTLMNKVGGAAGMISSAASLILFATAIDVLGSAVKKMGDMSWSEIAKGLTATTALIVGLTAAAQGISGAEGGMVRAGAALILLAYAIKILDDSVKDFSKMNWSEITKGLTGVGSLLVGLTLFSKFAETDKVGLRSGAGLLLLATGILVLADAAQKFGNLSWGEIAKGLTSISAILLAVTLFTKGAGNPGTLLAAGVSLVGIAAAMDVLALAIGRMGNMSWGEIAKGLITMAGALVIIVAAVNAMPPETVLGAAALVGVAIALQGIARALDTMGGQSWGEVAKGLVELAGALTIIALAATAMVAALPGAAAILVIAAALVPLSGVLVVLGNMGWGDILKSLVALAGALTVLGVASVVLTPTIPSMLLLGAAIAAIGVGAALAGGGVALFGIGLTAIAASGAAAAGAIGVLFKTVVNLLPTLLTALGDTLAALGNAVAKAAPAIGKAMIAIVDQMLNAITKEGPHLINTFATVIEALLNSLDKNAGKFTSKIFDIMIKMMNAIAGNSGRLVGAFTNMILSMISAADRNMGKFVDAGGNFIVHVINGISGQLGKIITAGTNLVINFIQGITNSSLKIINAAADAVVTFVNGLASAIRSHSGELRSAGGNLASAIIDGMSFGLSSKVGGLMNQVGGMATGLIGKAKGLFGIKSPSTVFYGIGVNVVQGFINGISQGDTQIANAWHSMGSSLGTVIQSSQKEIEKYSVQLYLLSNAHNKNAQAIYLTTLALNAAKAEYAHTTKALADLNAGHSALNTKLMALGKQWDAFTPKIQAATQALVDATKVRDDFAKQTSDQFNVLPDTSNASLTDFTNSLTYQVADLKKFTDVLTQLRGLGLNDNLYKELLSKGPASLQFAEQLLAGGSTAVKSVDSLSDQLTGAAGNLGTAAGTALYQAGVNAAQGVVDGLKAQQDAISAQMSVIAAGMVNQIKHDLGIKSPSTVFSELGQYVVDGLANGLQNASSVVDAATAIGQKAKDAMAQALSDASDLIDTVDVNPTIAPVVDLTQVRKGLAQLDAALADKAISVDASLTSAQVVGAGVDANKAATAEAASPVAAGPTVNFTQNNNSPKALATADVYRLTNNLLSRTKGALETSAA